MSSFFSRKKDKKNLQLQPPSTHPASFPTSPHTTLSIGSTSTAQPSSPSPSSPAAQLPPPSSPSGDYPVLSIKKTKKRANFLSSLFHRPASPASLSVGHGSASSATLQPMAAKKKGGVMGLFRRKKVVKRAVPGSSGEVEEREVSVSVTVSRLHRGDDDDDGLQSMDDDILIFPIFGIPLTKVMDVKLSVLRDAARDPPPTDVVFLPKQMTDLCDAIRVHGLSTEGVFRISGESDAIKDMKDRIDRGEELDLPLTPHPSSSSASPPPCTPPLNVHNLTGLFKLYWRSLPEPLFPFSHYDSLISAVDDKRLDNLSAIVGLFPEPNRSVVHYLLSFLAEVACEGARNKMTSLNLAVCFAPNLVRAKEERAEQVLADAPKVVAMVAWLIDEKAREERERKDSDEREERARQARLDEERAAHEAEVRAELQREKERRRLAELTIQQERDRLQREREREEREAMEREIEAQVEAERRRKERALALLKEQEERRKEKAAREAADRKVKEHKERDLRLKAGVGSPVLDRLPSSRERRGTDGESGEPVPTFFAIPSAAPALSSTASSSAGAKAAAANGVAGYQLPPFTSSQLPVVILMPKQAEAVVTSVAPAPAPVMPVSLPRGKPPTFSTAKPGALHDAFAASAPILQSPPGLAGPFTVTVSDEDDLPTLLVHTAGASEEKEAVVYTYHRPSSLSKEKEEIKENSRHEREAEPTIHPSTASVHVSVSPMDDHDEDNEDDGGLTEHDEGADDDSAGEDEPAEESAAPRADRAPSSSVSASYSISDWGGLQARQRVALDDERRKRAEEVARLEEALKEKKAEEEERRRVEAIDRLKDAMHEKELRKARNAEKLEEEAKEREREMTSVRQEVRLSKEKDDRSREGSPIVEPQSTANAPPLPTGVDVFALIP